MMRVSHITINDKPLCACETHGAGLLGWASPIPREHQSCSFKSIAAAKRAKLEMQRHRSGVRVVVGPCPILTRTPPVPTRSLAMTETTPPRDRWISIDDPEWPVPLGELIDCWHVEAGRITDCKAQTPLGADGLFFVEDELQDINHGASEITHYRLPPLGPHGEG